MFEIGDNIIYVNSGVCRVVEICEPNFSREEQGKRYYKLRPLYGTETIYAPVDTTAFMRPAMTRQEAEKFVARIPEMEECVCAGQSITLLRQQYDAFFKDHDCETYVQLVKGVHSKGQSGKKLGQTDQRYCKRAEDVLYGELAAALDIRPEEVPEYIRSVAEGE